LDNLDVQAGNAVPAVVEAPWKVGWRAAKANLVPGLGLQALMLVLLVSYYGCAGFRDSLAELAALRERWGILFSVVIAVFSGAFFSEAIKIIFFQKGHLLPCNRENLLYLTPFWVVNGAMVHTMYGWQVAWFGNGMDALTLMKKVAFDQGVFNPCIAAPFACWIFEYQRRKKIAASVAEIFSCGYYARRVFPLLIATWGVWIPVVTVIYSLPLPLQMPVCGVATCFWSLMLTFIGHDRGGDSQQKDGI